MTSRGYWARSLRRLARDRTALLVAGVLMVVIVAGSFADQLAPYAYNHFDLHGTHLKPTAHGSHFFGTDSVGHDTFSQTLFAIRTSILIGFVVAAAASLLGLVVGAVAGFYGGWIDALLMRVVDFLATIPALGVLFTGIVLTQRQPRPHWVSEALILYLWTGMARVVRARLVSLRHAEYVDAARAAGASGARIVLRHLVPERVRGDPRHRGGPRRPGDPARVDGRVLRLRGDPFLFEAILMVTVVSVVALTLVSDALYALLDPRIRIT